MADQKRSSDCHASVRHLDSRITKKDLYVCVALWMERSPQTVKKCSKEEPSIKECPSKFKRRTEEDGATGRKKVKTDHSEIPAESDNLLDDQHVNEVGVVIVNREDRIVAVDYSREGLHGVINALVAHSHKVRDCDVYVSRKPCSLCTKFMVQMDIKRVWYLPFEPENPDSEDLKHSEQLCRFSGIAQSAYVPCINKGTIDELSQRRSPYSTANKPCHKKFTKLLMDKYWNENWTSRIPDDLMWSHFEDVSKDVHQRIIRMMDWIAMVTFVDVPECTTFHMCGHLNGVSTESTVNNTMEKEFALHMTRLAHLLSQRSDDPTRGVGAVITKKMEVVAVGWNGFPSRALYGDFPRGRDRDEETKNKKYPFSTHAEQSAILTRCVEDISHKTTTVFVSKMPCNDCVPIMSKVGVSNVVFPPPRQTQGRALKYNLLLEYRDAGRFKCYVSNNGEDEIPEFLVAKKQPVFNGQSQE